MASAMQRINLAATLLLSGDKRLKTQKDTGAASGNIAIEERLRFFILDDIPKGAYMTTEGLKWFSQPARSISEPFQ